LNRKIISAMALILLLFIGGCNLASKSDPTIATVNSEKITQSEYVQHNNLIRNDFENKQGAILDETKDKELIDKINSATFDDLILQKLVGQDAQKQGIKVNSADIDSVLNSFKQSKNSLETDGYQKFLDQMKVSEKDLRAQIEISQLYDMLQDKVTANITVSDADAQKYYNDNPIMFQDQGGIQIYHILVDTEPKASEVMAKIKQGGDFAALAKQYSLDPGSKDQGGDVGLVNDSTDFVPEFKKAALALQPGQLYPQPVKTEYGYHIIKAGDKKTASQMSFEQIKEQLKLKLINDMKDQTFNTYLEQLKNNADIKDLRAK
jgi:parvulin-like peptidyl-prolyl isomerase